ncbi:MAG: D-amino acid aminotransferase [Gammaproteobacteria bacterium]|nr:D-amino acid aminotransferase [Gammaproteobacteria bacterium]
MPDHAACVPVLDRGFIFGDGIYEVIPVYHGCLFRLPEHLQRLQNSLDAIRIVNPHSTQEWHTILNELIDKNNSGNLSVYLQVTRGVAKRDHALPENIQPTVFAMANPLLPPEKAMLQNGVRAITGDDYRWRNCHIKAISLLPNILLRQQAIDAGAYETILLRDGEATEGAASNLFIVENNVLVTPPKGPFLLPGITRDLILELAIQNHIACEESVISEKRLRSADEIWLTSSTREILPVTYLDNQPVGDAKPGPLWHTMVDLYQTFKQSFSR